MILWYIIAALLVADIVVRIVEIRIGITVSKALKLTNAAVESIKSSEGKEGKS